MTEQLQLADLAAVPAGTKDPEAGLTVKQRFVLTLVAEAGHEGLTADEAGAAWCHQNGKHSLHTRCLHDGRSGSGVLKALERRGLVTYRRKKGVRPGGWVTVANAGSAAEAARDDRFRAMLADSEALPF